MYKPRSRAGPIIFLCLILMPLLVSCNYPRVETNPSGLSIREVRQTLDAISILTPAAEGGPQVTLVNVPETGTYTPPSPGKLINRPGSIGIVNSERFQYFTLSGDTLPALAGRFGVSPELILSPSLIPAELLLPIGTELWIPNRVGETPLSSAVLPDGEVIYSPTAIGFDVDIFVNQSGGTLSSYAEMVQNERLSGAEIIQRVATESSVNPRLLLALIELRSGWVRGLPGANSAEKYPIGFRISGWEGLYKELVISATHLNAGYYGWRDGSLTQLQIRDGSHIRLDPRLNAGTIGVQNLLSKLYDRDQLNAALYGPDGFGVVYLQMFGDPWRFEDDSGPIYTMGITQPSIELPFSPGERWSLTGGPHPSWKTGSPRGALDLAPVTGEKACTVSYTWVTAPASGLVARSARNVVALDLDGDGYENTGWVIIFLHIADRERVQVGSRLNLNDRIGHPSCEGGTSTGTHFHIARKYSGEWIAADGPLPFVLGGWQAYAGVKNYQGGLIKNDQEIVASPVGPRSSIIMR
jgi:LasA protease